MNRATGISFFVLLIMTLPGLAWAQAGQHQTGSAPLVSQVVKGGFLGVFLSDVNEARARDLKLTEARGAAVAQVVQDSPAAAAHLLENDAILSYNQERIQSAAHVYRLLMDTPPGRAVTLGISRAGNLMDVVVTIGERPQRISSRFGGTTDQAELLDRQSEALTKEAEELQKRYDETQDQKLLDQVKELNQQAEEFRRLAQDHREKMEELRRSGAMRGMTSPGNAMSASRSYRIGIKTLELSEQLEGYFGVPAGMGVLVSEVEPGSAAARVGLQAGDCLIGINDRAVQSGDDVNRLISEVGNTGSRANSVTLKIIREHKEQVLSLAVERR